MRREATAAREDPRDMVAALVAVSTFGWIAIVAALSVLALAWLVSLFAIILDDISIGAKLLWLLLVTVLSLFAIPVYFVTRGRRRRRRESELRPKPAGGW